MDVCTIIAKNYLAQARVLARSFAEHHPDVRFHVLVIDDVEGFIDPAGEPFELVPIDQLGIERFGDMAVMYDVLELSTAVKPWLLRHLLAGSADGSVVYLDPDMRLYAPLDDMFAAVRRHGLVLSPHNLGSMPRDGRKPNEQDILIAGVYNLGFVGINSGAFADELLDWWAVRLERDCIVDPQRGFFVDQRWMDFAPGMAESFHLLRDPGFNVAYWNLHARPVSQREGEWRVAGDFPLRLFHFSGYDHRRPDTLSKHQDRIDLAAELDLRRLCDDYADALRAEGVETVSQLPYTYATTASGLPLNGLLRRMYRTLTLAGFDASPFEPDGEAAFLAELNAPAEAGGAAGITRYLEELHRSRPDLQRVYPDLDRRDGPGFLGWVQRWGHEEVPIPAALLPADRDEPNASQPPANTPIVATAPPPVLGVNVAGYLTSEMGVGEIARQMTGALDSAGITVLPVSLTAPRGRHGHAFGGVDTQRARHPINLVCVNADMLPQFAVDAGEAFFEHRHTIGMWWWEVSAFPERWHGSFDLVDEIWAGSRFVAETLAATSPVPVVHVPVPVTLPGHPVEAREALGLPDGFVFLFVYDYNSVMERKNPLGLLDAFLRAFPSAADGASLVLKSINAEHHPDDHARVVAAATEHPHVQLLEHFLSPGDKNRLIVSCDAYVSLHRSEGFGITMAEAMLLGKPVVATNYSGNTDFMTAENSWPVRYELRPIGPGADPYPASGEWADPDLDHAAACLREVFDDPATAAARGRRAAEDITRRHSLQAVGQMIAQRLRAIQLDPRAVVAPAAEARSRASAARWLLDRGPQSPDGRRRLPARAAARRAVLRTIKPHTAHQAGLDRELAAGVGELADGFDDLARRLLELDTERLRAQRALDRRLAALEIASGGLDTGALLRAADARIDVVASQLDALSTEQQQHAQALRGSGLLARGDAVADTSQLPEAPREPWTHEYNERHRAFVSRELDDAVLIDTFRRGAALPDGFGTGFDERVVEFPWVAAQRLGGKVLDAGSTLNHLHVLSRLRLRMDDLHIVTLAPEGHAFPELHVSYLYGDLRELPMADGHYDRVVSISTLEHVGMDNTYYGTSGGAAPDPQHELLKAVRELRRVLRPGGDCYITVPVGSGERFEWVRTLTDEGIGQIVEAFAPEHHSVAYYRHSAEGWQVSTAEQVTGAYYRDHFTSGPVKADRIVAAQAVACLHLVKPAQRTGGQ